MKPIQGQGVVMVGFSELIANLQAAAGKGNFGIDYEFKRRLAVMGEAVAKKAPEFVTHTTGHHGDPAEPRLEDSVKVSVTARSVTVYSTSIYGGAQNSGAGPKAGWAGRGPHIRKDKASRWMNRAVASQRDFIAAEAETMLDWVVAEIER